MRCIRKARLTWTLCEVGYDVCLLIWSWLVTYYARIIAMTAAQTRLADTIDTFYGAADKASDSAMAGHAYKRAVDELDTVITRELVRLCGPPRSTFQA